MLQADFVFFSGRGALAIPLLLVFMLSYANQLLHITLYMLFVQA